MAQGSTDDGAPAVHGTIEKTFERLIGELRPKLHRYCARMTGSVIDGEDVVQEALLKAIEALPSAGSLINPEGWLFRIAHNAALDYLRRRTRYQATHSDEDFDMIAAPANPVADRQSAAASLRTFMRLPATQRSSVILRDVLGYSVEEICDVMGGSIPAIKGALQRGRMRLSELAQEPDDIAPPALAEPERARLMMYVERFNARDFDSLRNMLADDVRLDLVNRLQMKGRGEVREYFHRYSLASNWRCVPGFVDRRPAILMFDPNDPAGRPAYFIVMDWSNDSVVAIQDFHFARYAVEGAELLALD
ncbi:RNA polymerase sigma-70 factor, ECF subfamily [Rhizobiales bacterium GAS191]|nr:RNA polymerase sigma-70 factor, ECF subfamily [Rhizobiales bacterium GAS191]